MDTIDHISKNPNDKLKALLELNSKSLFSIAQYFSNNYSNYENMYISEQYCPFCNFELIHICDIYAYLLTKYNTTIDNVKNEIRQKFKSYNEFKIFILGEDK